MKWFCLCCVCLVLCSCGTPVATTTDGSAAPSSATAANDQSSTAAASASPAASIAVQASTQASAAASSPSEITATEVIHYQPSATAAPSAQGSCWTSSIAINRPDAYRCMQENQIFDPCFATADSNSVTCEPDPIKGDSGTILGLNEPLPELTVPSAQPGDAWLVELEDGSVCSPFTGTRSEVDGKITTYSCATPDGAGAVLLGDLAVGTVWHAEKAIIAVEQNGPQLKHSEQLAVRRVWQ